MATIKSYTDIEQSRKLAETLPIESADMGYLWNGTSFCEYPVSNQTIFKRVENIPCWSLAALLEQFPYELCDDDGNSLYLEINKEDDVYQLVYADRYGDFESIETDRCEHFVDACYEMIAHLHKLNLL